jgi:hypothetical protein
MLLALGLLVGCEQSKTTTDSPEADAPEVAKISADGNKKAAGEEGKMGAAAEPEVAKTGDDGHKKELTKEEIEAAKATGILGLGATPADIAAGESNVYGANFTIINEPVTLASAIAEPTEDVIKVSAEVKAVCQKKGCWMTLEDEGMDLPIRVKMNGYKFFVPKNSGGTAAVLEGTLKKTVIPQAEAQHYADDAAEGTGKPAKKVTGDVDSYIFMANAIQLTKPKS